LNLLSLVMNESAIELLNPAVRDLNKLKEETGNEIEIRQIGIGGKNPNLEKVFSYSLLGDRLSGYEVDESKLGPYERKLREKPSLKIHTIIDFDGVLISPIHLQNKAGFKNMLWLARVAKSSDETTIWTNRFQPAEGKFSKFDWFPFLGKEVSRRITSAMSSQGKVEIKKKKLYGNGDSLAGMSDNSDLIIFIGSSRIDREIVREYIKKGGDLKKLIYFDTGHLIL